MSRPVLVVGDIQGDVERLDEALAAYPEDEVDTVFLGDFFQGGRLGAAGGVAAARRARTRRHSRVVLGNHDLFILVVLEVDRGGLRPDRLRHGSPARLREFWEARRGDPADLAALAADPDLESWLRTRPFMLMLDDGTLVQHTDDDVFTRLGTSVDEVNAWCASRLASAEGVYEAHLHLMGRNAFTDRTALDAYLRHFGATRLVHGHTPHWHDAPDARHDGLQIGFDGRFSRYWPRDPAETTGPITATVGLLPPLDGA